jgi:hypothetical protein
MLAIVGVHCFLPLLGGCVTDHDTQGKTIASPAILLRDGQKFDGKRIAVKGWLDFGFERRHLFELSNRGKPEAQPCISVEIDSSVRSSAEELNHTSVLVEGVFTTDLAHGRIFFGLCSDGGIQVSSIKPLTD